MESRAGQAAHFRQLAFEFLDVVFAEFAQAQRICVADDLGGKDFREASSMICVASQWARSAALAMRSRTSASLCSSVSIAVGSENLLSHARERHSAVLGGA